MFEVWGVFISTGWGGNGMDRNGEGKGVYAVLLFCCFALVFGSARYLVLYGFV